MTPEKREELLMQNMNHIRSSAHAFYRNMSIKDPSVDEEDLVQMAMEKFYTNCDKYDESRGAWSTFTSRLIRNHLLDTVVEQRGYKTSRMVIDVSDETIEQALGIEETSLEIRIEIESLYRILDEIQEKYDYKTIRLGVLGIKGLVEDGYALKYAPDTKRNVMSASVSRVRQILKQQYGYEKPAARRTVG